MRKFWYAAIAVAALGIFSVWYFVLSPELIKEGFEGGLGEWVTDADVPLDPNNPGQPVEWNITRVSTIARSGQYSLKFFIDGRQDDGTIWIERKISANKNAQVQVGVSFEFYSESQSFNTIAAVCVYAGTSSPEAEIDLAVLGAANQVAGWKKYTHSAVVNTDSAGEVWVAVGISVRWETLMTYYVDDVEVEIK